MVILIFIFYNIIQQCVCVRMHILATIHLVANISSLSEMRLDGLED